MISINRLDNYKDYGRVVEISNGIIEAYVTVDLGPRIIRFGFVGGENIMCDDRANAGNRTDKEYEEFFGKGKKWENMGGHRIWTAPESYPYCYNPDDQEVIVKETSQGAIFTPPAEIGTYLQKELEIKMDDDDASMQVTMRVTNLDKADKDFAIWGLSVCSTGGTLVLPTNDNDTGLLSNRKIIVWPYTDLTDERIYFGKRYVTLKQDIKAETPIKLGLDLNKAIAYYCKKGDIFCKRIESSLPNGNYPDGGCNFETYTNDVFIEVESLGELKTVKSGETAVHREMWSLYKADTNINFKSEEDIDNLLSNL